jgi:hypothetical protein
MGLSCSLQKKNAQGFPAHIFSSQSNGLGAQFTMPISPI